jgi:hypothetical protein
MQFLFTYFACEVKLIEYFQIFELLVNFFESIGPYFFKADIMQNRLSLLGIIPKICLLGD